MSYKLEVPPLQPSLASVLLGGFGSDNALRMEQLPHTNMMLALLRDGFHPDSAEARSACAATTPQCSTTG